MNVTRVLLVEDERGYARFLREVLQEAEGEYDVTHADTAEAASARLKREPYDIVLLDLGLPDADGTEALSAVAAAAPQTPIVVLSALADLDVALESMRLGAQEYLVKGQAEHFLLPRTIRYAIERRRHQDVLAAARLEAERANGVKDDFLAMLGHELRNPLAPIVTGLALIRRHGHADIEHHLAIVERQVQHVTSLVDDLLDVSRIARGKMKLEPEYLDLADVVAAGVETVTPLIDDRKHVLSVDVPPGTLGVHGDRSRLCQVVANLLGNAAKYTAPRGRITVTGHAEGEEVVLRVADNGSGMTPELLARVFELFEQGERTIDRAAGGLGLGLPIVRSIVQLHGGTVTARSDGPGRGSELIVRLPRRSRPPARAAESATPRVAPTAQPRRVLIVDDNADAASLLRVGLEQRGHITEVAHDGESALAAAEKFLPEVVLLDIGLPLMDGYEVARRLRARFGAATKLVAVTGYGSTTDRHRATAAGFDAHFLKPVDLSRIESILADGGA